MTALSERETGTRPVVDPTAHPRFARIGINALVLGLWLWLYRPVFDYLAIIFSREDFRVNQLMLAGVIVLVVIRVRRGLSRPRIDAAPQLHPPALALAIGGSLLYLAVEHFLDVNTASASLFGLASYGLLGLWMQPARWRQGLPAALLLVGTLPFGEHMQTFVGYPARVLTAAIVRDGLAAAGAGSVGVDTILVFENGVSKIDLPCSGIKSLWAGLMFLIAATWVERRRLDLYWLLTAFLLAGLLLGANVARVGVLVAVGQVAGWRLLAEMLHVPLGVLGFAAACAAVVLLLRLRQPAAPNAQRGRAPVTLARPAWLAPALAVAILAMALVYTPRRQTELVQLPSDWVFPPGLVSEPLPLEPEEIEWLNRDGAESAGRFRFEWRGGGGSITGSVIFVTSTSWRAHHNPERCLMLYGLSLDGSRTHLVRPDFPVRHISLGGNQGEGRSLRSGTYWFQSAGRTTDDYATRIWADAAPARDRWVLVSILFDDVQDPDAPGVRALYVALHDVVNQSFIDSEEGS